MRLPLLIAILAACGAPPAGAPASPVQAQAKASSPEVTAIQAVLEEFRRAIIARDSEALLRVMVSPDVPFRSRDVETGELNTSTAAEFAREVGAAKEAWEERFWNVDIRERDGIAVLDCDYLFSEDKRVTNHGREVWTLIRTPEGWKITMVLWSTIGGPPPR